MVMCLHERYWLLLTLNLVYCYSGGSRGGAQMTPPPPLPYMKGWICQCVICLEKNHRLWIHWQFILMAISYNLINVAYLYFYCYKIFAIKPLWKWISMHPSEDISSSSLFKLFWFVCKPTTGFAPNWSGKIQHSWLHKIWAGLPIDGGSKFPWHRCNKQTLNTSSKLYCCFSRDKQHFVSFITRQSFLLTFESTIDCSAFTMNTFLFFLLSFSLENSCWEAF